MINRVLIYNSGRGIGNAIQIIPIISTLKKELKSSEIFYLCASLSCLALCKSRV